MSTRVDDQEIDWQKWLSLEVKDTSLFRDKLLEQEMYHKSEPYRVCRRVNILRDYSDEKTKLYPRN